MSYINRPKYNKHHHFYGMGFKGSKVQILSSRPEKVNNRGRLGAILIGLFLFSSSEVRWWHTDSRWLRTTNRWLRCEYDQISTKIAEFTIRCRSKPACQYRRNVQISLVVVTYEVRMYDIRHRFASELFSNNVSVGVVSRLIGHSRTSTTTDVYLEVLPKEIFEIRNKLPSLDLPVAENQ